MFGAIILATAVIILCGAIWLGRRTTAGKIIICLAFSFIVSTISGWIFLDIVTRPAPLNAKALPPFFMVLGFSSRTGRPELVKLYEYSAVVKEAAKNGLDKEKLLRDYKPIIFDENDGEYSYAIDPARIAEIEKEFLKYDVKFEGIDGIEIKILSGQDDPQAQRIALHAFTDETSDDFIYEVRNGNIRPIAYGDETRAKIWRSMQFSDRMFLLTFITTILLVFGRRWFRKNRLPPVRSEPPDHFVNKPFC